MYPGQYSAQPNPTSSTVRHLLTSCSDYQDAFKNRIAEDVVAALDRWRSLRPETENHFDYDGSSAVLVLLKGVVPIQYQGVQYNIPMTFWITKDYPLTAPLAYVTPDRSMQINRSHSHVAADGKVFLPYYDQWNPSRSSLQGAIEACAVEFGLNPPVHSRRSTPPPPPPPLPAGPRAAQPRPPAARPPPAYGSFSQAPYPVQTGTPPPPPYPAEAGPSGSSPGRGSAALAESRAAAIRQAGEAERAALAERKAREAKAARQALEIRLQEEFRRFRDQMKGELGEKLVIQRKLDEGHGRLEQGLVQLEEQNTELESAIVELKTAETQLETWLAEYEDEEEDASGALGQLNLDEAIVPADTASRQLFDCVAETSAIDDTLYHLDRALSNDVVDLATFLKEVRKLARRQFMAKALAKKIQKHQQQVEMQARMSQPNLNSRPPAYRASQRP